MQGDAVVYINVDGKGDPVPQLCMRHAQCYLLRPHLAIVTSNLCEAGVPWCWPPG